MFISTIFGDLGDLLVVVRRPKGALKIFLVHSLGKKFERFHQSKLKKIKGKAKLSLASTSLHSALV